MAEYEKEVRKIFEENGCRFVRHGKCDHAIWHSPVNNHNVAADSKIKSRHMANAILKESGIEKRFR